MIVLRPDNEGTTRASFSFLSDPKGYEKLPSSEQKALLREKFTDAGWEASRIMNEMEKDGDVYFDAISRLLHPVRPKAGVP